MAAVKLYFDEDVHMFLAHVGIIVATQDNPRRNLRALFTLLHTLSAQALHGQLVYLNNWV